MKKKTSVAIVSLLFIAAPVLAQFGAGTYNYNSPGINYTVGSWLVYNNQFKYSSSSGAQIEFAFVGDTLTINHCVSDNRGTVQVCIDGNCSNYSAYHPIFSCGHTEVFNVGYGAHIVVMTKASGTYIDLMSITVSGVPPITPTPEGPFLTPTPWGRPTPTMWAIDDGVNHAGEIAFNADESAAFADTIINSYNFLDQGGAISTVIFFLMSFAVLGLMFRVVRRARKG